MEVWKLIGAKIASSEKESRVCVGNALIIGESKFQWCFFVVEDEQVTEKADVLMWI